MEHKKGRRISSFDSQLIIVALATVVFLLLIFWGAIIKIIETIRFDEAYKQGEVSFSANLIMYGEQGLPAVTALPTNIPEAMNGLIASGPRNFSLTGGCTNLVLPSKTIAVWAATESTLTITINIPAKQDGGVDICLPENSSGSVVLWPRLQE